jgi:DNA-binding NtrC family response regulator
MLEVRRGLATLISPGEFASLVKIFSPPGWSFSWARNFADLETALRSTSFGVVICGSLPENTYSWKDVASETQRIQFPPQLIIADRMAAESLWVEVLHFGCYDLLRTPFDPEQALPVVCRAWDFWEREKTRLAALLRPASANERSLLRGGHTAARP